MSLIIDSIKYFFQSTYLVMLYYLLTMFFIIVLTYFTSFVFMVSKIT